MTQAPVLAILQVQSERLRDEHPIVQRSVEIGRRADSDIVLDDRRVSRRHALLVVEADGMQVQDLGSANGTLLNGEPLPARLPTPLNAGDVVRVGPYHFSVRYPSLDTAVLPQVAKRLTVSERPGLAVYYDGRLQKFVLDAQQLTLGRRPTNDIVIPAAVVSGKHARLDWTGSTYRITDLDSSNGLVIDRKRITTKDLVDGDVLHVTPAVTFQYRAAIGFVPVRPEASGVAAQSLPTDDQPVRIGRATDNEIVLDHPQVSRYHAMIERMGVNRYRIRDLKSSNGVFVNNTRIDGEAWLKEGDRIQVGPVALDLKQGGVRQLEDSGMRLDATGLQQWVSKEKNLLQEISLSIHPQEFVALVGLSGAGKSTLMNALNGFWPATQGTVRVNDVDLYQNFDLFRNELGYVPQRDIVHTELTVHQALDYAAQLRMPADTSEQERDRRIDEVLQDLDLEERRDLPINKLSGGQLKRVSIGVELLTKPRLFYLDEPTSGLDPGTEYNMMKLMRRLADQGRTIVLITHATKNVMMCDKVIFLVRGGRVAFYGPPEDALAFFDRYRTKRERREKAMEFDNIYIILEDEKRGSPEQWGERYLRSNEYRKYVVDRLRDRKQDLLPEGSTPTEVRRRLVGGTGRRVSALRQLAILSRRNLSILFRDKLSLALMLAVAPGIGLMDFMWGRDLYDPVNGDPGKIITMWFMAGLITILTGAISSVLQIVRENDIYKRERIVGLQIGPYILSKVWIGLILALYQALVFLVFKLLFANPELPGAGAYFSIYLTLFLGTLSGYLFGLAISAGAPNLNVAMLLVIVVLVPQFLFAGALLPLDLIPGGPVISVVASTRWSFEALVKISGMGDRLVEDPCWDTRPKTDSDGQLGWNTILSASEEVKRQQGCLCMGQAIFSTCSSFPGIQSADFLDDDTREALVGPEPKQPPEQQGDDYESPPTGQYSTENAEWQRQRERAIQGAEGLLKSIFENYGQTMKGTVSTRWAAMGGIMAALLVLIVVFQKRKDVV